ncbi:hypothetical protein [Acanthopleuribacter pedis]|uniref:Uncharacterized protein n=1 Tax=Acanthopleuribacter pedis TaxID=442870 RepID=A0A8J7QAY0_9BACT|nr:hypothetical protein [Acanthopleuribacter pedis]MBO1317486.1 hypothetical protein [Acanthopleuribacter pedis]
MVLFFLNMEFIILTWVDMWGEGIGWGIRFAMVIAGIACFVMGGAAEEEFEEA